MPERKKIYLINPASGSNVAGLSECIDLLGYGYLCANLSLPTLAALVDESRFEVTICDENVDTVDLDFPCDTVGLTIYHYQRERTYELATEFRKRGRFVIVGGPFATQNLQQGHPLFDVVFVGEAEHTWLQFLDDYLAGRCRKIYEEYTHPDITSLPPPRFDLMRNERYLLGAIQISRGCPFRCDFCSCTVLYGREMRYKTDAQVLAELSQLHRLGYRALFILDDNLAGDRQRVREILLLIRDWNNSLKEPVMFSTSASVDIAGQSGLAPLFADALITNVFVGLETPNLRSLEGAQKFQNLKSDPLRDVEIMQRVGIDVAAGIMVGFDDDDLTIFRRQFEFLQEACIPVCFAGMVLAPDGTPLKERLIQEGRYLGSESVRDHTFDTNVAPKLMTVEQLRHGYFWLMSQLYDEENYVVRVRGILERFPKPHPLMKRYKPREIRRPLKLLSVLYRLFVYYMTNGSRLRIMGLRFIPLLFKRWDHVATTIYWMIAFKHFRQMLIKHGVYKRFPEPEVIIRGETVGPVS